MEVSEVIGFDISLIASLDTMYGSERFRFDITKGTTEVPSEAWIAPGEVIQEWEVLVNGDYWLDYAYVDTVDIYYSDGSKESWSWAMDIYNPDTI